MRGRLPAEQRYYLQTWLTRPPKLRQLARLDSGSIYSTKRMLWTMELAWTQGRDRTKSVRRLQVVILFAVSIT